MWKLILVLIIGSLAVDWCAFLAMKEPMVYREDKFEQIILADGKYVSTPRNSGYFQDDETLVSRLSIRLSHSKSRFQGRFLLS